MDNTLLLVSSHAGACRCIIDGLINAKLSTVQGFQLYAPSIHDRLRQDRFGRVLESFSRRNRQSEVTHQTDELRCSVWSSERERKRGSEEREEKRKNRWEEWGSKREDKQRGKESKRQGIRSEKSKTRQKYWTAVWICSLEGQRPVQMDPYQVSLYICSHVTHNNLIWNTHEAKLPHTAFRKLEFILRPLLWRRTQSCLTAGFQPNAWSQTHTWISKWLADVHSWT